jgi:inner membrane protein
MDPVTHTLVGASLAQAGLKKKTALGSATLLIGANFPDIDVFAYFWGSETALGFRRGLTHGVLALAVLPLVLTGLILVWDRAVRRRRSGTPAAPVRPGWVLLLAALAIATHPLLDFLNVYGMRWLAPFSWTWFYGDALFIVDPWVWMILASGLWLTRQSQRWSVVALSAATLYAGVMGLSGLGARALVRDALVQQGHVAERMMVAPLAVTPFTRWVVVQDDADAYRVGLFRWLPRPSVELQELAAGAEEADAAVAAAVRQPAARHFLRWARFPYYDVERRPGRDVVYIGDARYTLDPQDSWAATRVEVDPPAP